MFSVFTDFDSAGVDRFKQVTEEKLRDVRCPDHHQAPRLRFHGSSLRDITVSLSGCCAKVMEIANARIGRSSAEAVEPARANS
ncbi:MAG TPA: hypothetical protein VMH05_04040 [Bryobacteraceae bacterium]|nr:hypothetical protein [Bryobacteraceae bacterium]